MKNIKSTIQRISWHNILLALVFFALGYLSMNILQRLKYEKVSQENFDLFWQVWSTVEEKYPFEEPSEQDKIYGAIAGLVASYEDDYSVFLPPVSSEFFNQTIEGEFGGIGAEIGIRSGYLTIVAPLKGSPAEQSGIKSGDIITHVDSIDITGDTLDEAIGRIRGKIGTDVILTLIRLDKAESIDITITRDTVTIPVLDTEVINDTFVIHLYNFNESSADKFKDALLEFKSLNLDKLLIDVRNNPGGYLTAAVDMASYFLPQGDIILREQYGTNTEEETLYRSIGYSLLDDINFETKVLINQGSASASEILAGALSDHGVADIIGESSYGKGSVQEFINLPDDTSLKVTVAKWLTPNRRQISGVGIEPDQIIEVNESISETRQLEKAINSFNEL